MKNIAANERGLLIGRTEGFLEASPETDLQFEELTPAKLAELRTTHPDFVALAEELKECTTAAGYREPPAKKRRGALLW